MQFRFRFLNEVGDEVHVESTEDLSRHFDEGRITETTLLYDAITQEWAPARSHPMFRLIAEAAGIELSGGEGSSSGEPPAAEEGGLSVGGVDAQTSGEDPDGRAGEEASDGGVVGEDDGALLDIELTPHGEPEEDAIAAFLAERERERREAEMSGQSDTREVVIADETIAPVHRESEDLGGAPAVPPARADSDRSVGRGTPPRRSQPTARPSAEDTPSPIVEPSASRRGSVKRGLDRYFARARLERAQRAARSSRRQAMLFVLLLAVGAWGIYDAWSAPAVSAEAVSSVLPVEIAPPERPAPGLEAARSAAFQDMVRGMDRLRSMMELGEPPSAWMSGPYLADAAAYPEVLDYWQLYQRFVIRLRAEEQELFRSGFVRRMQSQGITGAVLSLRVAAAMRDFQADAPRRHTTYAAMDELADAALDLHGFLVDNTDRIDFADPTQTLAEDPVLEAVPTDEATREELWVRIERLLEGLDQVAGPDPQRRRDVSQRVLGELADPGPVLDTADAAASPGSEAVADTLASIGGVGSSK